MIKSNDDERKNTVRGTIVQKTSLYVFNLSRIGLFPSISFSQENLNGTKNDRKL